MFLRKHKKGIPLYDPVLLCKSLIFITWTCYPDGTYYSIIIVELYCRLAFAIESSPYTSTYKDRHNYEFINDHIYKFVIHNAVPCLGL